MDVVKELLENSAYIEHRDMVGELSLMGIVVERAVSPVAKYHSKLHID